MEVLRPKNNVMPVMSYEGNRNLFVIYDNFRHLHNHDIPLCLRILDAVNKTSCCVAVISQYLIQIHVTEEAERRAPPVTFSIPTESSSSLQFISVIYISGTPGDYKYSGPLVTIIDIIMGHLGLW